MEHSRKSLYTLTDRTEYLGACSKWNEAPRIAGALNEGMGFQMKLGSKRHEAKKQASQVSHLMILSLILR